ncbi:MAG: DUF385 domain-containing protein [Promethearchaeota archaeon]|nr:MAG: DUF385 domain-containing protein [Candidatus Lokiarchaeota archaeon]
MSNSNDFKVDNEQLPREGSVMYNFHHQNEATKEKTLKRWKKMNNYFIIPLYRIKLLPVLGFGKIILVLITKGWKTGKTRRTPLEYRKYEGDILIFAARGENATWVKNLRKYPESVSITLGFHQFRTELHSISEPQKKIDILKWYITKFGRAAKTLFGWNPKEDNLNDIDLSKLVRLITIFRLKL